ncbi:MAG: hypothetical protein R6W77_03565 [Trueperaceae bacterium]
MNGSPSFRHPGHRTALVGALAVIATIALLVAACAPGASRSARLAEAGSERTTTVEAGEGWEGYLPATPGSTSSLRPRPDDAADMVIIAFSGHCGLVCRTEDTWSYLDTASEETGGVAVLDALVLAYERLGLAVETFSASSFVTSHYSKTSDVVEPGYLQAQAYLDDVKREWIDGVDDPTRVVLLGHSHGTVWATLLAMNNIDVTFDAFVSLDAICWQWWGRHKDFITETFVNGPWTIPFPLDQGDPCNAFEIPGMPGRMDINDVVPANVVFGIEVRTRFRLLSLDPNVLADDEPNVRINGTTDNVWGIRATEAHSDLGRYYNQSIAWVTSMISALGVPDLGAYPMATFVLPPAPGDFGYRSGLVEPLEPGGE